MHECKWDSLNQEIIIAGKDSVRFSYTELPNGNMQLKGYWQGKHTNIPLAKLSIDSLNLIKDKFLFMLEDQEDKTKKRYVAFDKMGFWSAINR